MTVSIAAGKWGPRVCTSSATASPRRATPRWPAYRLLGKKDLGTSGDYLTDRMPAVNTLIGGELAWRQHSGGHTNGPNFPTFYEWAGRYISTPGVEKKK